MTLVDANVLLDVVTRDLRVTGSPARRIFAGVAHIQ